MFLVLVLRSTGLHKDLIRALTQRWWFDVESEWLRNERDALSFISGTERWQMMHRIGRSVLHHVPEFDPDQWLNNESCIRRNINSGYWFRDDRDIEDFMHHSSDDEAFQSQRSLRNQPLLDFQLKLSLRRKRRNKKIKL